MHFKYRDFVNLKSSIRVSKTRISDVITLESPIVYTCRYRIVYVYICSVLLRRLVRWKCTKWQPVMKTINLRPLA